MFGKTEWGPHETAGVWNENRVRVGEGDKDPNTGKVHERATRKGLVMESA